MPKLKHFIFCLLFALYLSVPQTCIDGGAVTLEEEQDLSFNFKKYITPKHKKKPFHSFVQKPHHKKKPTFRQNHKKKPTFKQMKKKKSTFNSVHTNKIAIGGQKTKKNKHPQIKIRPRQANVPKPKNQPRSPHSTPSQYEETGPTPKYKCDPKTTCRYDCGCGQGIFLNLATWPFWNQPHVKKTWNAVCSGRLSAHEYISQIKQEIDFRYFRALTKVFTYVIETYDKLCANGAPLSEADYIQLEKYFLENSMTQIRVVIRHDNGDFNGGFEIDTSSIQLNAELRLIYGKLIQKLKTQQFEHCDCKQFFHNLGYNHKHPQYRGLENSCRKKCSSSNTITLEFED